MMPQWLNVVKFYFLVVFYSAKYLFYYFINTILHPHYYKEYKKISIPPRCLSAEDNGLHQYTKLSVTFQFLQSNLRAHATCLIN